MVNTINNSHFATQGTIESSLLHIEQKLRSDNEIRKKRNEELIKSTASIALSVFVVITSFFVGSKATSWLQGCEKKQNSVLNNVSGICTAGAAGLACKHYIIYLPKSIEDVRKLYKQDIAFKKLSFKFNLDKETTRSLQNIVSPCPITGSYPRFPVRDIRLLDNGQKTGQIYDWPALQFALNLPKGSRLFPSINFADYEDFEFCEDECRAIHSILFSAGKTSEEDPVRALLADLNIVENISVSIEV